MTLTSVSPVKSSGATNPPGFRFHPTDGELIHYYLRRKVCGKSTGDVINDIEIYKVEPWDLPVRSRLTSGDAEWYFFSSLENKHCSGSRVNRATDKGYWKTTGKDRPVLHKSKVIGTKKILVYHTGRVPRGKKTNWIMHEYRLVDDEELKKSRVLDAYVVCRIIKKNESRTKNCEQNGTPLLEVEEQEADWILTPGGETQDEDAYVEADDRDQVLCEGTPENASSPVNSCFGNSSRQGDEFKDGTDDHQKNIIVEDETHFCSAGQPDKQNNTDSQAQPQIDTQSVHSVGDDKIEQSNTIENLLSNGGLLASNATPYSVAAGSLESGVLREYFEYLFEYDGISQQNVHEMEQRNTVAALENENLLQSYMDNTQDNLPFGVGLFANNNFLNLVAAYQIGPEEFEEYFNYLFEPDAASQLTNYDSPKFLWSERTVVVGALEAQTNKNGGNEQASMANMQNALFSQHQSVVPPSMTYFCTELPKQQTYIEPPRQYEMETEVQVASTDIDDLIDELYMDATENNPLLGDALLATNDFAYPTEGDPSGLDNTDDCVQFFDAAEDDISQHIASDSPFLGIETLASLGASTGPVNALFSQHQSVDPPSMTCFCTELPKQQNYIEPPRQYVMETKEQLNTLASPDIDDLIDERYMDATENNPLLGDGSLDGSLATNDLAYPIERDPSGLHNTDDCVQYFDAAEGDISQNIASDSPLVRIENLASVGASTGQMIMYDGNEQVPMATEQHLNKDGSNGSSYSMDPDATIFVTAINQYTELVATMLVPPF